MSSLSLKNRVRKCISVRNNNKPRFVRVIVAKSIKNSYITVFKNNPKCNDKLIALSFGQMLCSIATLIHDSYLPIYVQNELGVSNTDIGAIQGLAQFLCQVTKGVSGVVGDIVGSHIKVVMFGTALSIMCKPMFALLSIVNETAGLTFTLYWFFIAKLFDRMSKGIREAPTKAIMNDLASQSGESPDAAYGFRQSLATAGMLIGTFIASIVFTATGKDYILTFIASIIPTVVAMLWLVAIFLRSDNTLEKDTNNTNLKDASVIPYPIPTMKWIDKLKILVSSFKPAYWQALAVVATLYFARFDGSFVTLRAKNVMDKRMIPMLFLLSSLIQTVFTVQFARYCSNNVERRNMLLGIGFLCMIISDMMFGLPMFATQYGMFVGATFLGFHMSMTHSITLSMLASYMPKGGTAVSFTDLILGFVLAASNILAGYLCDLFPNGCFIGGASACCLALMLLGFFSKYGDIGAKK